MLIDVNSDPVLQAALPHTLILALLNTHAAAVTPAVLGEMHASTVRDTENTNAVQLPLITDPVNYFAWYYYVCRLWFFKFLLDFEHELNLNHHH